MRKMKNNNEIEFTIAGLMSEDDVREVAERLLGVEGVDDVQLDLGDRRAFIQLSEGDAASEEDLRQAVRQAGFDVEMSM